MNTRSLLRALWRQRWVAALLMVVTVGTTLLLLERAPRVYEATASVGVLPAGPEVGFGEVIGPLLPTLSDVVRGTDLLGDVASRVPGAPPAEALRDSVRAAAVPDTLVLRVSVQSDDPVLAARLANEIVAALPRYNLLAERVVFQTVNSAVPPATPVSPQVRLVTALAVVLGLGLATAGALLLEGARRRLEDVDELAAAVGAPVLAAVPPPRDPRTVIDRAASPSEAAAVRRLRISLEVAAAAAPLPTVVMASVLPDDTNAWLAANTALSLAQVHDRVLLLRADPDSRGPDIGAGDHHEDHAGLAELLAGSATLEQVRRAGIAPSLTVIDPGIATASLPTLLETRFDAVARTLVEEVDVVIIEAPPVLLSDDARVMAVSGGVVLSTRLDRVSPREVREAVSSLRVVSARIVGCVAFTDSAPRQQRRRRRRRRW